MTAEPVPPPDRGVPAPPSPPPLPRPRPIAEIAHEEDASPGTDLGPATLPDHPVYAIVLWASDWAKERNPENRANLYDFLRACKDPDPDAVRKLRIPRSEPGLQALTPKEWAEVQAEDLEDPWEVADWEREHEIE